MRQMQAAHQELEAVEGLNFYKLLGSGGGNGFSILPDLSTYAFLAVWEDQSSAENFLQNHSYSHLAVSTTQYHWTIYMIAIQVKGTWEGGQPFPTQKLPSDGPIAVLTRATINANKLWSFWKNVPRVSHHLEYHQAGLLFSKGIGEIPLLQQATFSIWKSRKAMVDYAYRSPSHQEMIKKTRSLGWYKEELFAEFVPTNAQGTWPDSSMIATINDFERPRLKVV